MRRLLWAGVVVLAFPAVAAADAAIVYRPGDSGYARAKLATQVVHGAALCAVVTGVAWAANSYGRNRTAAFAVLGTFCFVMLVFWNGSRTVIATPDTPPAEEEVRPAPGAVSGEEVTLFAAIAAIVLAGYGVKVARRRRRAGARVPAASARTLPEPARPAKRRTGAPIVVRPPISVGSGERPA